MSVSTADDPSGAEQVPRLFGILNLVLGVLFSIGGLCCGLYTIGLPVGLEFAQTKVQQAQSSTKVEERGAQIEALKARIAETTDDAAKAKLIADRIELEADSMEDEVPFEIGSFGAASPEVAGVLGLDLFAGLVLNFFMMVSGVGLLGLKRWGRGLALGVAWLRLLQVAAVTGLLIAVTGPALARGVSAQLEKWEQAAAEVRREEGDAPAEPAPPAPPADPPAPAIRLASPSEMGRQVRRAITYHALGSMLFTAAYPLFTIYGLTRPPVKAAFRRVRESEPS